MAWVVLVKSGMDGHHHDARNQGSETRMSEALRYLLDALCYITKEQKQHCDHRKDVDRHKDVLCQFHVIRIARGAFGSVKKAARRGVK